MYMLYVNLTTTDHDTDNARTWKYVFRRVAVLVFEGFPHVDLDARHLSEILDVVLSEHSRHTKVVDQKLHDSTRLLDLRYTTSTFTFKHD